MSNFSKAIQKRRYRGLLTLLFVMLAASTGGCGSGEKGHSHSVSKLAMKVATGAGASADVGRPIALIPAETSAEKHYLNDGDYERVGDSDGDNRNDNDKDPTRDYLPSDYREGENNRYHDADDRDLLAYGRAPTPSEEQAVTRLVKRYYAKAAAEDGAGACTLLSPSLARAVPADYGEYGPSYLHGGKTCAAVMALLFRHYHKQLSAGVAVTGVRLSGNEAYALLGSPAFPPSFVIAQREEGNVWTITQLLGTENKLP